MLRVIPFDVHQAAEAPGAHLRMVFADRGGCITIPIGLDQASLVTSELHGVPSGQSPAQALAVAVARALGADLTRVVLHMAPAPDSADTPPMDSWGYLAASVHLQTKTSLLEVEADVVTAITLAMRLQLPIWIDGDGTDALTKGGTQAADGDAPLRSCHTPMPSVFQEALRDLWSL